jgi:outer membrane protein OmpA-like peptidoglycan-associated protein
MNNVIRYVILIGSLCYSYPLFCQNSKELVPGYYVVVAAYAKSRENVAQNFVEVLRLKGLSPSYGYNSSRNLYFVYLNYFNNLKESLQDMKHTRGQGEFTDAWVRVVHGDIVSKGNAPSTPVAAASSPPDATVVPKAADVSTETKPVAVDSQPTSSSLPPAEPEPEVTENPPIKQYPVMTLGNTEVFLSLYNARNNRIVDGTVQVVDTDRSRLMTSVKGNEYLLLPDPKSKSGQLTLICEAFGYRKIQEEINYPLPLADTVKSYIDLMGTTLVINFDLVRYHKGDIATLYNVYFYNDAALMLPESKFELGSLLQLMNENPNYRIRLHGHTNGNYTGKILTVGQDKNFFSLDGAQQSIGSAKDLSRGRAEVIRDYLVSNGVNSSRMEIKAWGGKRPIFDKNSANAKKNVRVEVEILEE